MMKSSDHDQKTIAEAIRKIALGRGVERVDLSPDGTSGIGTARLIHGYVAKVHNDPSDEEYATYAGTVDVGEYCDETASVGTIVHKGVLLTAALQSDSGSFLVIPTLFSDVTILTDAANRYAYLVNYSRADVVRVESRTEAVIGVSETEELDAEDEESPDYDGLRYTGNEAHTRYSAEGVNTTVRCEKNKESSIVQCSESIVHTVDESEVRQCADEVVQQVKGTSVVVKDEKVTLGDDEATEPLVLGHELAQLMLDFLTECSQIMTPTLLGTMQPLNFPNFTSLTSRIEKFLSKTCFTK